MVIEKKGELTLSYGVMLFFWDTSYSKLICVLHIDNQYIGTFKTFLAIDREPQNIQTFSDIWHYGFGAKERYDSLGNLLSWLNRSDDFSLTAIFRKTQKDEIVILHDPKLDEKKAELQERNKILERRRFLKEYQYNQYAHYDEDSQEKKTNWAVMVSSEDKLRQNKKDLADVENLVDLQEGIIQKAKDNAISSALIFDYLYKPVISYDLNYLLGEMPKMYNTIDQSIKAKMQQFGLKTTEVTDADAAISLFFHSLLNPKYYEGIINPAVQEFKRKIKEYYETNLAEDVKHEGYEIKKQYNPAVVLEQIINKHVSTVEQEEKIHIPNPKEFHYGKDDCLLPIGFVTKSIAQQKLTDIPVNLRLNELSRSLSLFGLQGQGKSLFLQYIGLGLYMHGIKGVVIDPHSTLTGCYKRLSSVEVRNELNGYGIPIDDLEDKGLLPAKGRIYTALSDDGHRFATKLLANPVPENIINEHDRRAIAQMYTHSLFADLLPRYCLINPSHFEMGHLQNYCVERFIKGEDVSLQELHAQLKDPKAITNFSRILDLESIIDSDKPTSIRKIIEEDGLSTILLNKLNVFGSPEIIDMVFISIFNAMHKYSQSLDYETNRTERVLLADELGVLGRKNTNEADYIGACVREDRKRGTGYVLGSQRSVHISPSARSTNMAFYFRTDLINDVKTLKAMYPEEAGDNVNDVSLVSKLPRGYVFANLGSDFYKCPLYLKLLRPPCQHTGLTSGEIREMMAQYKEDAPKFKFEMLTVEDRILQKVKELNDRNVKPSKNMVCREVGGMKERVLGAINALIAEGKLRYDTETGGLSFVRTANQFGQGGGVEREY